MKRSRRSYSAHAAQASELTTEKMIVTHKAMMVEAW
jgi:hypothetical protein